MRKLTKRQALTWCRDLWQWMADNGKTSDKDKIDWPGWEGKRECVCSCPCCEYVSEIVEEFESVNPDCELCPLRQIFNYKVTDFRSPCKMVGPYISFNLGEGTKEDAMKIIRACEKELRKLDGGE